MSDAIVNAEQIGTDFVHTLPSGETLTLVIMRESCGNYFAIEASYLEQEVGPVISPYGNGKLILDDEELDNKKEPCPICKETHDDEDEPRGFENCYICPRCQHEWTDVWCSQVDDECPKCGERHISPRDSLDVNPFDYT